MFSPRQLLVHATFVEKFQRILPEITDELGEEQGSSVAALLALMQGKALNWNALMSSWDASRSKTRSVFERHDLAFKWTYTEFEGGRELLPWCLSQIVDSYTGIADLYVPSRESYAWTNGVIIPFGSAADLMASRWSGGT